MFWLSRKIAHAPRTLLWLLFVLLVALILCEVYYFMIESFTAENESSSVGVQTRAKHVSSQSKPLRKPLFTNNSSALHPGSRNVHVVASLKQGGHTSLVSSPVIEESHNQNQPEHEIASVLSSSTEAPDQQEKPLSTHDEQIGQPKLREAASATGTSKKYFLLNSPSNQHVYLYHLIFHSVPRRATRASARCGGAAGGGRAGPREPRAVGRVAKEHAAR